VIEVLRKKTFGKIQRNRISEMKRWTVELKKVQRFEKNVRQAIVAANNHYAGFGPGTVRTFRGMMELPEITWEDKKDIRQLEFDDTSYRNEKLIRQKQKQTSISDFLS
jgi:hypothetical protein